MSHTEPHWEDFHDQTFLSNKVKYANEIECPSKHHFETPSVQTNNPEIPKMIQNWIEDIEETCD
jgi:hypothetical protein